MPLCQNRAAFYFYIFTEIITKNFMHPKGMQWQQLYTTQRSGSKHAHHSDDAASALRTSFVRDYDRIVFSSAFRRLQNKTQVFPLPGAVFVHNRLTHSMEVASVGRSLGREVGHLIAEKYGNETKGFQEFYQHELGTVIAAACLAHDIGNPPFGHSGEDAIRAFFSNESTDLYDRMRQELSEEQRQDFRLFEGNSNAFRVLTHAYNEPANTGGYGLTLTTLAAIVKYPCIAQSGFAKEGGIARKKSGFFMSELHTWQSIVHAMGILPVNGEAKAWVRHPFVYLTEAADDISYRIIDLEDAHRLGITSLEKIKDLFLPFFKEEKGYYSYEKVATRLEGLQDDNQKVQYLRAVWIGLMVDKITQVFMQHEADMLAGTMQRSLMDLLPPPLQQHIEAINQYSVAEVYNHRPVVEVEITGYHIIGALLEAFTQAVLHPNRSKSKKVLQLIPKQFRADEKDLYRQLLSVVDYIAGMTDLYAIDLYRKMTGISVREL
ncbi:MAG: deoxyguanosinetriphosphate triphosphohydrolase [Edaphocola sp.]